MPRTENRRPEMYGMARAVADDIRRVLGRDPRLRLVDTKGLEFLLSMGLLVRDPSDRAKLLVESLPWAIVAYPTSRR